jgi:SAM-dependent methyltransferase
VAEIPKLLDDEKLRDRGVFAQRVSRRGHRVIGVDSSPDMLAYARRRVPDGEFRVGELDRLPLPGDSVDVIVCAPALVHVPRLEPVLAEFARVLRPRRGPGHLRRAPRTRHPRLGDHSARPGGRTVRRGHLPASARRLPAAGIGDWPHWPWSLMDYLPSAARAAGGRPSLVVWHFQLPAS